MHIRYTYIVLTVEVQKNYHFYLLLVFDVQICSDIVQNTFRFGSDEIHFNTSKYVM